MKYLKHLTLIVLLTASSACFAQKIKLKKEVVYVDGAEWLKYSECGTFDETCSLYNLAGDEIIFFKWVAVDGVEPSTPANSKGTLRFVEVSFLGLNKKFEIQKSQKDILELLYKSKVVVDGKVNEEAAGRLVEKYGADFSHRY